MKVGIVNHANATVDALRLALSLRQQHRVAWVAHDGTEAVHLCATEAVDLILMGLGSKNEGIEFTRRVMAEAPCAILIVAAAIEKNIGSVYEAMGAGAIDAVNTPVPGEGPQSRSTITFLTKIDMVQKLVGGRPPQSSQPPRFQMNANGARALVAIGASAGGPAALATLLSGLPKDFPAGLVVVQHVDQQFASGLADWLSKQSVLPVRLAVEGDEPAPGAVLLAGSNDHLVLTATQKLNYTSAPEGGYYRPSIDVFFRSVQKHWRADAAGVLLTGMGRDGAKGLKSLRDAGHYTVAQNQATCAVYGMPKAAVNLDAAVDILPLSEIPARLQTWLGREAFNTINL